MKELLEDMLLVLNSIPDRKLKGKDWTTYELAKRVEQGIKEYEIFCSMAENNIKLLNDITNETKSQTD